MNNFEEIKKCKNEYEMANRISKIVSKLCLCDVDRTAISVLVLMFLQQNSTDL